MLVLHFSLTIDTVINEWHDFCSIENAAGCIVTEDSFQDLSFLQGYSVAFLSSQMRKECIFDVVNANFEYFCLTLFVIFCTGGKPYIQLVK